MVSRSHSRGVFVPPWTVRRVRFARSLHGVAFLLVEISVGGFLPLLARRAYQDHRRSDVGELEVQAPRGWADLIERERRERVALDAARALAYGDADADARPDSAAAADRGAADADTDARPRPGGGGGVR